MVELVKSIMHVCWKQLINHVAKQMSRNHKSSKHGIRIELPCLLNSAYSDKRFCSAVEHPFKYLYRRMLIFEVTFRPILPLRSWQSKALEEFSNDLVIVHCSDHRHIYSSVSI